MHLFCFPRLDWDDGSVHFTALGVSEFNSKPPGPRFNRGCARADLQDGGACMARRSLTKEATADFFLQDLEGARKDFDEVVKLWPPLATTTYNDDLPQFWCSYSIALLRLRIIALQGELHGFCSPSQPCMCSRLSPNMQKPL